LRWLSELQTKILAEEKGALITLYFAFGHIKRLSKSNKNYFANVTAFLKEMLPQSTIKIFAK